MSRRQALGRAGLLAVAVAVLLAQAPPAHAYRMLQGTTTGRVTYGNLVSCHNTGGFAKWSNQNILWYHNTANQGWNKATALQSAMASWTGVAGADHTLTYAGTTTAGFFTDGINTAVWAVGNGCTGSCLALTALVLQSGQVIVESDVTFNNSVTWTTNGLSYDTQTVAAHELGHTLGIHHTEVTSTPRPTMYATYFGMDGRSLESDDRFALQCAANKALATSCAWSGGIKESAGTQYVCPSGKVMTGRQHSGDENGTTYYQCCNVGSPQAFPTTCSWSPWFKESNGTWFSCPTNQFMVGRQHSGDENGSTRYYCCNLSQGGLSVPWHSATCAWSSSVKESSSNFECPSVMVGRRHYGDENGQTWYQCCNPSW
jgi:hypothetical protein